MPPPTISSTRLPSMAKLHSAARDGLDKVRTLAFNRRRSAFWWRKFDGFEANHRDRWPPGAAALLALGRLRPAGRQAGPRRRRRGRRDRRPGGEAAPTRPTARPRSGRRARRAAAAAAALTTTTAPRSTSPASRQRQMGRQPQELRPGAGRQAVPPQRRGLRRDLGRRLRRQGQRLRHPPAAGDQDRHARQRRQAVLRPGRATPSPWSTGAACPRPCSSPKRARPTGSSSSPS